MRDVQDQVYDLTVQIFQNIKRGAVPVATPAAILPADQVSESQWIEASMHANRRAHALITDRYKMLILERNSIATKNPTNLSTEDFLKAYEVAKKYLDKNPGKKIQAIKEVSDHFNLMLKEAKDVVELLD